MSGELSRDEVLAFLDRLERGELRAAEPDGDGWRVNPEVKEGILRAFRLGVDTDVPAPPFAFRDRDTLPARGPTSRRASASCPGAPRSGAAPSSREASSSCRRPTSTSGRTSTRGR